MRGAQENRQGLRFQVKLDFESLHKDLSTTLKPTTVGHHVSLKLKGSFEVIKRVAFMGT